MYNFTNPDWANNQQFVSCVGTHVFFHQDPFASAVNLADKQPAPLLQQYPPINHLSKQEVFSLNPPAFWEHSAIATCIPGIVGAVPTSCQQSDKETHRQSSGTAQDEVWVISSGRYCPSERWWWGYPCPCMWMCMRASCEAVRNVSRGMEGACLSLCLHMINHYTWNPFTKNGTWTIGNVTGNSAGVNDRRGAGNEGLDYKKKVSEALGGDILFLSIKTLKKRLIRLRWYKGLRI